MSELAFLDAIAAHLSGSGLVPAPDSIGAAEPERNQDLPAVVLSLEESARQGNGLGERSALITNDALEWRESIDLSNPVLPSDPELVLVDGDRTGLILPHGGLVRSDGTPGPLAAGDVDISVDGTGLTLVEGAPSAGEFAVDPLRGRIELGTPLPASGTLDARYFLGQWERRVTRIAGLLRVDVDASSIADALQLSGAVLDALTPPAVTGVPGLVQFGPHGVSSVTRRETPPQARRRTLRFRFVYEGRVDRPESSGGVIRRVAVDSSLDGGRPPGSPAGEETMEVVAADGGG